MYSVSLVFPHQLFQQNPALSKDRKVILIEEYLFFRLYNFHKMKLLLHRATMQFYNTFLHQEGFEVEYIDTLKPESDIRKLIPLLHEQGIKEVHFAAVDDDRLNKRIKTECEKLSIITCTYASPNFLNSSTGELQSSRQGRYSQTAFYIQQRKKHRVLLNFDDKPVGGKWTYDEDNRRKFPAKMKPPEVKWPEENDQVKEARNYVLKHFAGNYGDIQFAESDTTFYPTNYAEAEEWLDRFLEERFENFGIYQDAMVVNERVLHHSVITPALNTGLLTPDYVLKKAVHIANKNAVPLNSTEGFIRQILGWREYMHLVYLNSGTEQRNRNFWEFSRKIPGSFWKGETGILPVDLTIKKILNTAFAHHIERLMILGNFMLLCEFDPDEVYKWFMELFIDAYDWVMVPNIYGMSQFADGGLMSTKPYLSGSNYIIKMSNFPKGDWQQIWDSLFWRFIDKHRHVLGRNARMAMIYKIWDKMPNEKKERYLLKADEFLFRLDENKKYVIK